MDLIVFDLDGTLLNRESRISAFTAETLRLLETQEIAYTVATGRSRNGARAVMEGHRLTLPQAHKNGVVIWHPERDSFTSVAMLTPGELDTVVSACIENGLTPFVFTLDQQGRSGVYHTPVTNVVERELLESIGIDEWTTAHDLSELPDDAEVTHINAIGTPEPILSVYDAVESEPHLVAYSGVALEGREWRWLDVHHSDASKGGAILTLKELAGLERVLAFGDSDNDLSMFAAADESFAPANANERIKAQATEVIGHHDEDGVARFLRERFDLR